MDINIKGSCDGLTPDVRTFLFGVIDTDVLSSLKIFTNFENALLPIIYKNFTLVSNKK